MNKPEQHPDSELLDRLRSGLLDDNPPEKAELERHLRECEHCRRSYTWPAQLGAAAALPGQSLDQLRREALSASPARRWRGLAPLAAAAAVALVAVGVHQLYRAPSTDSPKVAASTQSVPDLYEDLDFYLWLADHKMSRDSST